MKTYLVKIKTSAGQLFIHNVSGSEACNAIVEAATEQYGPVGVTVLQ